MAGRAKATETTGENRRIRARGAEASAPGDQSQGGTRSTPRGRGHVAGRSGDIGPGGDTGAAIVPKGRVTATDYLGGSKRILKELEPDTKPAKKPRRAAAAEEASPAAKARLVAETRPGMAKKPAAPLLEKAARRATPGTTNTQPPAAGRVSATRAAKTTEPGDEPPTLKVEQRAVTAGRKKSR